MQRESRRISKNSTPGKLPLSVSPRVSSPAVVDGRKKSLRSRTPKRSYEDLGEALTDSPESPKTKVVQNSSSPPSRKSVRLTLVTPKPQVESVSRTASPRVSNPAVVDGRKQSLRSRTPKPSYEDLGEALIDSPESPQKKVVQNSSSTGSRKSVRRTLVTSEPQVESVSMTASPRVSSPAVVDGRKKSLRSRTPKPSYEDLGEALIDSPESPKKKVVQNSSSTGSRKSVRRTLVTPEPRVESVSRTASPRVSSPAVVDGRKKSLRSRTPKRSYEDLGEALIDGPESPKKKVVQNSSSTPSRKSLIRTLVIPEPRVESVSRTASPRVSSPAVVDGRKKSLRSRTPKRSYEDLGGALIDGPESPKKKVVQNSSSTPSRKSVIRTLVIPEPQVESVRSRIPCREEQFGTIWNFLKNNLEESDSGCMYVAGVPGTGKTLIVKAVVEELHQSSAKNNGPKFTDVYINGLSLSAPSRIWKRFYQELNPNGSTKTQMTPDKACINLGLYFGQPHKPVVLIIDELDQVLDKHQAILYRFLDWTAHPSNKLSLICIFNTMNLPENVMTMRNNSRMGLARCTFPPYARDQLITIVKTYLGEEKSARISDALPVLAMKVAAISGDARRAIEISKRTFEIVEGDGVSAVTACSQAFNELFSSPRITALRNCSKLEQLILQAIISELQNNGTEETVVHKVVSATVDRAVFEGLYMGTDAIMFAIGRLFQSRIILLNSHTSSIHNKITLNVPPGDIQFALGITESASA